MHTDSTAPTSVNPVLQAYSTVLPSPVKYTFVILPLAGGCRYGHTIAGKNANKINF